ncbi:hypothetical protein LPJ66_006264 [Kickxella alabastrina]|uniref:Uncharacterized protein n=1 Tax=Kickxella alabastrina TaxID=61397 RepID=A0ACC1IIA0_9FUNG|nr:hypothetical protein LPJ66_006264 [Kickxella alabastrina]
MTVDSLFILNTSGTPVIQKHWCDDVSIQRASLVVVPAFTKYLRSFAAMHDAEPVWSAPLDTVCIHIQRKELVYLGIVSQEIPPLEVLELLEGVDQALTEYIGLLSEVTIKENFTTVYQLLSEMVDSGCAVTTDTSVLRGLVPVPSLVNRVIENVSGIGIGTEKRPDVNTSSTPWRAQGIRHTNNEFFVDVVEKIDAIVNSNGSVVSYDVSGDIGCKSRLSGMPDLLLALNQPEVMDDVAFHPCVRINKWENEGVIGFVPPDGQFKLASFHVATDASPRTLPIYVHATTTRQDLARTIELSAEVGQCGGRPIEKVQVRVPLPAQAYNIRVQCKAGTYTVSNGRTSQVEWSMKTLKAGDRSSRLVIQYFVRQSAVTNAAAGNSSPQAVSSDQDMAQEAFVDFEVAGYSVSSIKVDSLKLMRESYKLFKGVRYITKAGSFQVRF